MAGAPIVSIVVLGLIAFTDRAATAMQFVDRLQSAIRHDLFVVVWLAATIANVARMRFFSERDIAGSSAETSSEEVREAGAIMQNTLEQVGLAIATHLIVAATFIRSTALIEALVFLFAIGRLLFR